LKRTLNQDDNSNDEPARKEAKCEDVTDLTIEDDIESCNEIDLIPTTPEITMVAAHAENLHSNLKIASSQSLNFEHFDTSAMPNERTENPFPNSRVQMLSSTSLLHGNCIFNRNNTVATQQGLKTYW
jgi:hypothetical protein